ncbi:MAG: glycerate kinase, partial [Bacteroidota bacterium]
ILIAPDKFKGSLTAEEVCEAIAAGLRTRHPEVNIRFAPLADGGDGSLAIIERYLHLRPRQISTCDPLGRALSVSYLENEDSAFIEVAAASGLVLLQPDERDPLKTSTYGTGRQLRDALDRGKRKIFLLLGGSATNDLGLGITEALDFTFYDAKGKQIRPNGAHLSTIERIEFPAHRPWMEAQITLLCDVDNPLYGPAGAAQVYAAQKGATPIVIGELERGARRMASLIAEFTGVAVDKLPGGGAAGGIGAGLSALIGAKLTGGFTTISQLSGLTEKITWADVVISGEGQVDEQSLQGKVVGGVLELCRQHKKECWLFAGRSTLDKDLLVGTKSVSVYEIMEIAPDVEAAMRDAGVFLTELARTLTVR